MIRLRQQTSNVLPQQPTLSLPVIGRNTKYTSPSTKSTLQKNDLRLLKSYKILQNDTIRTLSLQLSIEGSLSSISSL